MISQIIHDPIRAILFMISIGFVIAGLIHSLRTRSVPLFVGVVVGLCVTVGFMLN